jgi:hypothetical protein
MQPILGVDGRDLLIWTERFLIPASLSGYRELPGNGDEPRLDLRNGEILSKQCGPSHMFNRVKKIARELVTASLILPSLP